MLSFAVAISVAIIHFRDSIRAFGKQHWPIVKLYLAERKCLNFEPSTDLLVYSDDPIDTNPKSPASGAYSTGPLEEFGPPRYSVGPSGYGTGWMPDTLTEFLNARMQYKTMRRASEFDRFTVINWGNGQYLSMSNHYSKATLFVHRLTSRSGHDRLVAVAMYGGTDLCPTIWEPGTLWHRGKCLLQNGGYQGNQKNNLVMWRGSSNDRLRIFCGHSDLENPDCLIIPGEFNGRLFKIIGRLRDDDSIDWKIDPGWFEFFTKGETTWLAGSGNSILIDSPVQPTKLPIVEDKHPWAKPRFVAFCKSDSSVAIVFDDFALGVARETGQIKFRRDFEKGFHPQLISPDGSMLLVVRRDAWNYVTDWRLSDIETGDSLISQPQSVPDADNVNFSISAHGSVLAVAYVSDTRTILKRWKTQPATPLPDVSQAWHSGSFACWDDGRVWLARDMESDFSSKPISANVTVIAGDEPVRAPFFSIYYDSQSLSPDSKLCYLQVGRSESSVLAYWSSGGTGFQLLDKQSGGAQFFGQEVCHRNAESGGFFAVGARTLAHATIAGPLADPDNSSRPYSDDKPMLTLQDIPLGNRIYRFQPADEPTAMAFSNNDDTLVTVGDKPELNFYAVPKDIQNPPPSTQPQ